MVERPLPQGNGLSDYCHFNLITRIFNHMATLMSIKIGNNLYKKENFL